MDLSVAHGHREVPTWVDPVAVILQERGLQHERAYTDVLRAKAISLEDISGYAGEVAVAHTLDAMRGGAGICLKTRA